MKYVSMILCICLLVAAVVIMPEEGTLIGVGRGDGEDDDIVTVRELGDFLAFVMGDEDGEMYELSHDNVTLLSSTEASETEDKKDRVKREYSSGSIHEDCYITYSYDMNEPTTENQYKYTLVRTLSMYMTEDASYYHSKGTMSSVVGDESVCLVFDMEFYMDSEDALVKFNTFDATGNIGFIVIDDAIGKWFDMEDLDYIDGLNRDVLGEIGYIMIEAKDDQFEEYKKNIFTVDSELSNGAQVMIDLSNSQNPIMDIQYSDNEDGMVVANVMYSFENINNTVVELMDDIIIHRNIEKYFKEVS